MRRALSIRQLSVLVATVAGLLSGTYYLIKLRQECGHTSLLVCAKQAISVRTPELGQLDDHAAEGARRVAEQYKREREEAERRARAAEMARKAVEAEERAAEMARHFAQEKERVGEEARRLAEQYRREREAVARADFEFADRLNSQDVWEEFLRKHPTGIQASAARQRLTALKIGVDGIETVRSFYAALGRADGFYASSLVVPEKRMRGPFHATEITTFYSSLTEPLRVSNVISLGDNRFQADYTYRVGTRACNGSAIVTIVQREARPLIEGIKALNNC